MPGVDDEPRRAQRLARQHAEPIEVGRVQLHLVGEPLGVERPAFRVAAVAEVAADRMNLLPLERDRALQMMAGNRLVKRRRLGFDAALLLGLIRVDEEHRRPAAVLGRRVVFVRPVLLAELRVRLDDDVGLRQQAEPVGHRAPSRAPARPASSAISSSRLLNRYCLSVRALLQQRRHVARVERALADRLHLRVELLDLLQAGRVHLLRRSSAASCESGTDAS